MLPTLNNEAATEQGTHITEVRTIEAATGHADYERPNGRTKFQPFELHKFEPGAALH